MPPQPETTVRSIPPEMMEEILLHLPVKSLLCFYTVSKAWHFMIFDARFIQRHRSRSRAVTIATIPKSGIGATTHPLSSIHPDQIISSEGEPLICPKPGDMPVAVSHSATSSIVRRSLVRRGTIRSATINYKILKIKILDGEEHRSGGYDELYSLRSDSWEKTEAFPGVLDQRRTGIAASGALHWVARARAHSKERVIISFDLSTLKYAKLVMLSHDCNFDAELSVLRGKLCVVLKANLVCM